MVAASVLQMLFLELIPSTPVNGSLLNLTHDVYHSAIGHYKEIVFIIGHQKITGPKTTYLRISLATLRAANVSDEEHDIDNR